MIIRLNLCVVRRKMADYILNLNDCDTATGRDLLRLVRQYRAWAGYEEDHGCKHGRQNKNCRRGARHRSEETAPCSENAWA